MPGALLLGLQRPADVGARDRRAHLFRAMSMDDVDRVGLERARGCDDVREQRPAGQRLQHLRQVARHALALAGSQDDDGQGHRPNCTGAICRSAHKGDIPNTLSHPQSH